MAGSEEVGIRNSLHLVAAVGLCCCLYGAVAVGATAGGDDTVQSSTVVDTLGETAGGEAVERFTLTNANGAILRLISLGATISELHVRGRDGAMEDVVLGYDEVADYEANVPYVGCVIGRVANRIAAGRFELDGTVYELARNFGANHIHGGNVGFHQRLWHGQTAAGVDPAVRFAYTSPDGEEGYPGRLEVAVTYTLTAADGVRIDYEAATDRATPVNLTNHAYFNLAGGGVVSGHEVRIAARTYTERGDEGLPTGAIIPVVGTPLDFTASKPLAVDIDKLEVGYDHNFVLDGGGSEATFAAEVFEPGSGRVMKVFTTQPGVQLYTSYYLHDHIGKGGRQYGQWQALCLETQHYPDSPNQPDFPSVILRPGERYHQTTEYRFSVR